ncbi:hypothetical protein [Paenisporosarcina indica]|uniref:hypothetical protein n=1 Tax=Paenisporosarcina indica TaxID=650093 RepID=UPI000AF99B47|nr:hypothetical protein [Paenisporosarcina indica]
MVKADNKDTIFTVIALIAALVAQISTDVLIIGALPGKVALYISGTLNWKEGDTG